MHIGVVAERIGYLLANPSKFENAKAELDCGFNKITPQELNIIDSDIKNLCRASFSPKLFDDEKFVLMLKNFVKFNRVKFSNSVGSRNIMHLDFEKCSIKRESDLEEFARSHNLQYLEENIDNMPFLREFWKKTKIEIDELILKKHSELKLEQSHAKIRADFISLRADFIAYSERYNAGRDLFGGVVYSFFMNYILDIKHEPSDDLKKKSEIVAQTINEMIAKRNKINAQAELYEELASNRERALHSFFNFLATETKERVEVILKDVAQDFINRDFVGNYLGDRALEYMKSQIEQFEWIIDIKTKIGKLFSCFEPSQPCCEIYPQTLDKIYRDTSTMICTKIASKYRYLIENKRFIYRKKILVLINNNFTLFSRMRWALQDSFFTIFFRNDVDMCRIFVRPEYDLQTKEWALHKLVDKVYSDLKSFIELQMSEFKRKTEQMPEHDHVELYENFETKIEEIT